MGVLRRHVHKIVYALIAVSLVVTLVAGAVGGFRLHHSAAVERQTIRTQKLETAVLENMPAAAAAAYAAVARYDASEGRRLQPTYDAYVRTRSRTAPLVQAISAELVRQSDEIHRINPSARRALFVGIGAAVVLVLALMGLFELERRAGRIDRDNAARAEELIRMRDEFVAVVSHELRTPLTSIIGYLELMIDDEAGTLTDEHVSYLEIVQRSTSRLVDLVGDLLLVAEAERGPLALEVVDIDAAALAGNAVEAATPAAAAREIELVLAADDAGTLAGDPTRLAQMLDNLVSNAIKFTPQGGRVTVRAARRGSDVVVEVADTGGGITAADRERLFDPFFRSREANARAVPGTGLGLTITKAIVDAHHGTIEVESSRSGTIFRVRIPAGERVGAVTR
jgi:signal transduction histidine kinase